jgi:hypothetical protein
MRKVQVIGRRNVYDIDAGVSEHLFNGTVRFANVELPSFRCRTLGVVSGQRNDFYAQAPQRLNVHRPDEAGTYHTYSPL